MTAGLLITIIALVFLLMFSAGRGALSWFCSSPGLRAASYIIFLVKYIFNAHWIILRNLFLPHRVIFPTLERDDTVQR